VRAWLDSAIRTNPTSTSYFLFRGDVYLTAGEVAPGRRDYEHALRLDPNDIGLRLRYADVLKRLGLKAEARAELERALDLHGQLKQDETERLSEERIAEIRREIETLRD
jgi:predicted Zn-dependent protease